MITGPVPGDHPVSIRSDDLKAALAELGITHTENVTEVVITPTQVEVTRMEALIKQVLTIPVKMTGERA